MEYRFLNDNKEHLHQLKVGDEWKNLTGTTTVLGVIAKPALIPWAANMVVDHIRKNASEGKDEELGITFYEVTETLLEEARTAHSKRKTDAGEWGTKLHSTIEGIIKGYLKTGGMAIKPEERTKEVDSFIKWAADNKVVFGISEKNIYSERMWLGGIVDFTCMIDGKRWIGDIKTANSGIRPEHFWQCAAYDLMIQEMGDMPADGYLILNLKENGEFNEKRNIDTQENQEAFKSCLNIYRTLEKIKNTIL